MANNFIYPFGATASGANILDDAAYLADAQRLIGHQPGLARQELENKALKNSTVMAAALAQFIADHQAVDITDALTPAQIDGYLLTALNAVIAAAAVQSLASPGYIKLPGGLILQWGISGVINPGSHVAVTFPITFPTAVLAPLAVVRQTTDGTNPSSVGVSAVPTTSGMNIYLLSASGTADAVWLVLGK